jgi:glyoxylase-like metal-dependent hydrolase (beta-lactamase superfamily II)
VIHTPGHTEDSICLFGEGCLFSGDTLFVGTVGKFERGAARDMYESLYKVVMRLPDSTMVYPGHDYGEAPFRTLGEEKVSNPFLQAPDFRSFSSIFS